FHKAKRQFCWVDTNGMRGFYFHMAQLSPASGFAALPGLFASYQLGGAFDEMFDAAGQPRPQYRALFAPLLELRPEELRRPQRDADRAFLQQGITFTVYGDNAGTERIFPYDLLPRILTAAEWKTIERGLIQRLSALNLFLGDIYHDMRIVAEGVVPRELVL